MTIYLSGYAGFHKDLDKDAGGMQPELVSRADVMLTYKDWFFQTMDSEPAGIRLRKIIKSRSKVCRHNGSVGKRSSESSKPSSRAPRPKT